MRKVAVIRKAIDAKIDRTIFRLVRVVAFEKFPNHLDHLRDIDRFGSSWIGGSRFDAQSRYIVMKRPDEARRNFGSGSPAARLSRMVFSSTSVSFITR